MGESRDDKGPLLKRLTSSLPASSSMAEFAFPPRKDRSARRKETAGKIHHCGLELAKHDARSLSFSPAVCSPIRLAPVWYGGRTGASPPLRKVRACVSVLCNTYYFSWHGVFGELRRTAIA